MSGTVKAGYNKLENKTKRAGIPLLDKKHPEKGTGFVWTSVITGKIHLGYRRLRGENGSWFRREYVGKNGGGSPYRLMKLGDADDRVEADGQHVLTFDQAKEMARTGIAPARAGAITVQDAMNRYVEHLKSRGAADAGGVESRARLSIIPQLGHIPVVELKTRTLNAWRDKLAAEPAKVRGRKGQPAQLRKTYDGRARRATTNKVITALRAGLNLALREHPEEIKTDLAWKQLEKFEKVDAARPTYLTTEEATRLLNAADKESGFRDLVHAALLTGARYAELCRLTVGDFHNNKIDIHVSKSGRPRSVALTEEGAKFFEQICAGRGAQEIMLPRRSHRGITSAWGKSDQHKPMMAALQAARIDKPATFHTLRHTWCSLSAMAGLPLMVIAQNVGHTSTRMTEKHYSHLARSYVDEAVLKLAPRFGMVEPTNVATIKMKKKV